MLWLGSVVRHTEIWVVRWYALYCVFIQYRCIMLYKLLCLHRDCVALLELELSQAEKHTGDLVIDEWGKGNAFNRTVRRARLLTTDHSVQVYLLPPLFEPTLIKMTGQRMTLHDYQIHNWQGKAVHYAQVWPLKPTSDDHQN